MQRDRTLIGLVLLPGADHPTSLSSSYPIGFLSYPDCLKSAEHPQELCTCELTSRTSKTWNAWYLVHVTRDVHKHVSLQLLHAGGCDQSQWSEDIQDEQTRQAQRMDRKYDAASSQ